MNEKRTIISQMLITAGALVAGAALNTGEASLVGFAGYPVWAYYAAMAVVFTGVSIGQGGE